jgi:hypothetical protein
LLLPLFCPLGQLHAQVFEVNGGASSLYQVDGANITMHGPSYDVTTGLGFAEGHLMEGVQVARAMPFGKLLGGDLRIPFVLPTDVFDSSHYLLARGAGASITRAGRDFLLFGGATSTDYSSPYFDGAKTKDPAGMIFIRQALGPHWTLVSDTILTERTTSIASVQWQPKPAFDLALAAGEGSKAPYAAASVKFFRPTFELEAAYLMASADFHRVMRQPQLLAEPDRANATVTYKPARDLSLSAGHQEYLVPQSSAGANMQSQVDQAAAGLHLLGTQFNSTVYDSRFRDNSGAPAMNHAVALTIARKIKPRYQVSANYLMSRPHQAHAFESLITTLSEVVNSRLTVTQSISHASGNTSVNFGGEFLSNLFSASASYETIYVPTNNSKPFEQALMLDAKLNLFHRIALHASSGVDPTGHVRYTADLKTILTVNRADSPVIEHVGLGRYVLRGCVRLPSGEPVEGAAIELDGKILYTDSTGCFVDLDNKERTHTVKILPQEFLADGNWAVVSQPRTIASAPENERPNPAKILIVVRVAGASGVPASGKEVQP